MKEKDAELVKKLKDTYNIPEEKTVLLSLGRLGFEKQIDELLDGMKRLLKQRSDIVLLIVGGGPARESLELRTRELGIEDAVRFTGMVTPNDVADYYKLGDIFVCASTSETQGLTYIEAMASGLPLVCRKDPCLYGVLEEGGNGYSYDTMEEFAEEIEKFLNCKERIAYARLYSRKIAEKYGTKPFGMHVENSYCKALMERECEKNEGAIVCKEQESRFKKWCRACYAYAGRIS